MALACDLRLAVPEAKFFYPVMKLGFLPQPSDPVRLAALVGPARAKMILMAGQKIDAEEALAWGLVDRIVAREALDETVAALAADALGAEAAHVAGSSRWFPDGAARPGRQSPRDRPIQVNDGFHMMELPFNY